ncbi:MAG: PqqD family protein [Spirochaetales bacterium]|nr:PqqD family protein [Spirochaetales bacterium]
MDINSVFIVKDDFCVREIARETVLLSETTDHIHNLDEMGTFIFRLIDGKNSLDDILTVLCNDYAVDYEIAKADLLSFIQELQDKDIVEEI